MPKLSCIMSNYNTDPAYLQKAIESVLNQTFRDFELIIVDDCSTDMRSKKLIETLSVKDSRIKPVYNNVNMGLAASLNRAIAFSSGEYVIRFDTDDICFRNRFEQQYKYIEKTATDVVGSFVQLFGNEYKLVSTMFYEEEYIDAQLLFSCYLYHPSTIIRKEFLISSGAEYDSDFEKAEDFDFWVRCKEAGAKICMMPEVLLGYRMHAKSVCHVSKDKQTELTEQICKRQLDEKGLCYTDDELELHYILCGLRKFNPTIYHELCQWCDKLIDENDERKAYNSKVFKKVVYNRLLTAIAKADMPATKKIKLVISDRRLCNTTNIYSVLYKKLYAFGYNLSGREKEWMRIVSGE